MSAGSIRHILATERGDAAAVANAYRVYFKNLLLDQGGYTMDHTVIVNVMDKEGRKA
jgi:hypothetical protein